MNSESFCNQEKFSKSSKELFVASQENKLEILPATQDDEKKPEIEEDKKSEIEKKVTLPGGVELELVRVDSGDFKMGSNEGSGQNGLHTVLISRSFYLGKCEVTQEQWQALMGENPSFFKRGGKYPVENVSWNDAMDFCRKLTAMERGAGSLPDGYVYKIKTI